MKSTAQSRHARTIVANLSAGHTLNLDALTPSVWAELDALRQQGHGGIQLAQLLAGARDNGVLPSQAETDFRAIKLAELVEYVRAEMAEFNLAPNAIIARLAH